MKKKNEFIRKMKRSYIDLNTRDRTITKINGKKRGSIKKKFSVKFANILISLERTDKQNQSSHIEELNPQALTKDLNFQTFKLASKLVSLEWKQNSQLFIVI